MNTVLDIQRSLFLRNPHKYRSIDDTQADAERIVGFQRAMFARSAPGQGHFVETPDGRIRRIAHVWNVSGGNMVEWQPADGGGSVHVNRHGGSYSGSLERVEKHRFQKSNRVKLGLGWSWKDDHSGADRGVYYEMDFPVWLASENPAAMSTDINGFSLGGWCK